MRSAGLSPRHRQSSKPMNTVSPAACSMLSTTVGASHMSWPAITPSAAILQNFKKDLKLGALCGNGSCIGL